MLLSAWLTSRLYVLTALLTDVLADEIALAAEVFASFSDDSAFL